MKRLTLILIAALLFAVALTSNVATAEEIDGGFTQNSELYAFVEELCERQKSSKEDVRIFLEEKFNEALGELGSVERQGFENGEYVNLVATLTKANGANGQIIIGAHYDSVYEGAGDNACGVAALYRAMQLLTSTKQLQCSVTFVAFDGEEQGLLGSRHYVQSMTSEEIESTRVMFNIDTIATGDNLYVMCENKPTDLAKLILSTTDGLQEKPHAKGVFGNSFDRYGYGYYEMVQGSDHTPFRLAGIPIAFFFSGNYSATAWNYAESSDPSNEVMNTPSDTFKNLVVKHPDFETRINTVAEAVVKTVTSDEFMLLDARLQLVNLNFWYNVWWPIIATVVILVAIAVAAFSYRRKLQKNAILGESEIKTQKVFEKPAAEDIFSFKSDDTDDIFTFKK